jgi:hypothetical protein
MALPNMNLTHYLKYRDFIIFGLTQFEQNREAIRDFALDQYDQVKEWFKTSDHVKECLQVLLVEKSKSKKQAEVYIIKAIQTMINAGNFELP